MWCATRECADGKQNKTKQTEGTKHMLMSNVEFHVLCVEVGLDLGCHVVIGVVLGFTTQTQYQEQSSFLLDVAVHFCTCSQTVSCDRKFSSVANCCTILRRENGSFEVLSSHHPSVTVDRRQL